MTSMTTRRILAPAALVVLLASLPLGQAPSLGQTAQGWSYTRDVKGAGGQVTGTNMRTARYNHISVKLSGGRCKTSAPPSWCGKVLVAGGDGAANGNLLTSSELYDPRTGAWISSDQCSPRGPDCPGPLEFPRRGYGAALIDGTNCGNRCGWVVVKNGGGEPWDTGSLREKMVRTVEFYDPSTGEWHTEQMLDSAGQRIQAPPYDPSATALSTGQVLFTGSRHSSSEVFIPPNSNQQALPIGWYALVYDPSNNTWKNTGRMANWWQQSHASILLSGPLCAGASAPDYCGKALITSDQSNWRSPELYDRVNNTWSSAGLGYGWVTGPDLAQLPDGKVLMAGGWSAVSASDGLRWKPSKETFLYDPVLQVWAPGPAMKVERSGDLGSYSPGFLTPLPDGSILAAGSNSSSNSSSTLVEVFRPAPGLGSWHVLPGRLNEPRTSPRPELLACDSVNGRVLIAGGRNQLWRATDSAELFGGIASVHAVLPDSARVNKETRITIKGVALTPPAAGSASVKIGDVEATGVEVKPDGTEILATIPRQDLDLDGPVTAPVVVSLDGVPVESCGGSKTFTFLPAPFLDGVNPPRGPATGGSKVKLSGKGFGPDSTVKFGGELAKDVEVSADGRSITVTSPAGTAGPAPIEIHTAGDLLTGTFNYFPVITAVLPRSGPPTGGTRVEITGRGFSQATSVTVMDDRSGAGGQEVALAGVAAQETSVSVETPPHEPGEVYLRVNTKFGPSEVLSAGANVFTYDSAAVSDPIESRPGAGAITETLQGPAGTNIPVPPPSGPSMAPSSSISQAMSPSTGTQPGLNIDTAGATAQSASPIAGAAAAPSGLPGSQQVVSASPGGLIRGQDSSEELRSAGAGHYAMVARSEGDPWAPITAAVAGIALACFAGMAAGRQAGSPRARPQEAY